MTPTTARLILLAVGSIAAAALVVYFRPPTVTPLKRDTLRNILRIDSQKGEPL